MGDSDSYKILLTDDDQFLVNMYESKFKRFGHKVVSAASGEETLRKLKEGYKPDIIILDVVMPKMDGLEVLKSIREGKMAEGAAVVILSNQGNSEEIEKAKKLGIDGYIVKAALIPSEVVVEVLKIVGDKKKR